MVSGMRGQRSVATSGLRPINEVTSQLQRRGFRLGKTIGEGSYCKKDFVIWTMPKAYRQNKNYVTNKALLPIHILCGYRLGRVLNEGSYSKVRIAYRATELGYTNKVACKVINKKKASKDFVTKFLPREISIVRSINHPNIVSVYSVVELNDQVYMFMDYCEKGDLLDHIRTKGSVSETRAKSMFKQLVGAIEYLHSRDIAHRDLKCENVLLTSGDLIKIADFGFARWCCDLMTHRRVLSETFCGSAAYAAPEILQGIKYNPKMYDVWSLGCVLYIMLCATMPFDDSNIKEMLKIQLQRKISFPSKINLTSRVKRLVMHLLEPDITKRATIKQVAVSNWLNSEMPSYST